MNIFLRTLDLVELQLFQGWIKVVVFYIYIVLYGSVADPRHFGVDPDLRINAFD
jgi:hypothetical protein